MTLGIVAAAGDDPIATHLDNQWSQFPQEKIHVTTDKQCYVSGDTVWLRAFVVNAANHHPVKESKYVYAELINPFGSTERRVKIQADSNVMFSGYMPLPADLPAGTYTLAAYTRYMENMTPDYFFRKQLQIVRPQASKASIDRTFSRNSKGEITLSVNLTADGKTADYAKFEYVTPDGKAHTHKHSDSPIDVKLNPTEAKCGAVLVKFDDNATYIALPADTTATAWSVEFFPEGGYLPPDHKCKVAFKAVGSNGLGINVSGHVVNSAGNVVANITTTHAGMGTFELDVKPGDTYTATCSYGSNKQDVTLPKADARAAALRLLPSGSKIDIKVQGNVPNGSKIALLQRGVLVFATELQGVDGLLVNAAALKPGVVEALLLDPADNVLSSRLFFAAGKGRQKAAVSTDSTAYSSRSRVKATVKLLGYKLPKGNFAVSVTDDNTVTPDSTNQIAANLLMKSELEGNIENPGYYFPADSAVRSGALDALLLTQGWKRYDIPAVLQGRYAKPKIGFEEFQYVAGQVCSNWKKEPVNGASVTVIESKTNFIDVGKTDKNGQFMFPIGSFPDSVTFIILARDKKGKRMRNVTIEADTFPSITPLPLPYATTTATQSQQTGHLAANDGSWLRALNGGSIMLGEIVVSQQRKSDDKYEAQAFSTLKQDDIERWHYTTLEQAIRAIPGLQIMGDKVTHHNLPVAFYIDGEEHRSADEHQSELKQLSDMIDISTVKSIHFFNVPTLFSTRAVKDNFGGMVMIVTKRGYTSGWERPMDIKLHSPLGCQKPAQKYTPRYDVASATDPMRDLRSTIYWNPIVTIGQDGTSEFDFYTSDTTSPTLNLHIEGITDDGEIINTDMKVSKNP